MELIVLLPDATEVSLGQLKRFKESVIDPKYSMKVEATSFSFNNNLFFLNNIIFSCILLFCSKSTVYMLSKIVWNYNQH